MSSKSRKRKNPVSSHQRSNSLKKRKEFDTEASKLLTESDIGSYYSQDVLLQDKTNVKETFSASHSKIVLAVSKPSKQASSDLEKNLGKHQGSDDNP